MDIELKNVTIGDVVDGYVNNNEEGVVGYGGKLNIRPKYQREFVYNNKQRDLVMDTIMRNLPLNTMYWVLTDDGTYEVMDGQQRTISFASYVDGAYAINYQYFHNLTEEEQEQILDYELTVYVAEGSDRAKLDWFKTINIAGEKLSNQELRNAVYTGPWLSDAKRHFSKTGCPAYQMANRYMSGTPIRQDYLETVIKWKADDEGVNSIEEFMAIHQRDSDSNEMWQYFRRVINWVEGVFPKHRREMKGIPWGILYNKHRDDNLNSNKLEERVAELMKDEDVTKKKGIYHYLLDGNQKHLNIRSFDNRQKREAYEKQKGMCTICGEVFEIEDMEADHIIPWSKGGQTVRENCQVLCVKCNREKSNK